MWFHGTMDPLQYIKPFILSLEETEMKQSIKCLQGKCYCIILTPKIPGKM